MKIIKTTGIIKDFTELSKSAREMHIELADEIDVVAGCFINIFIEINGKKVRRAYSISSDPQENKNISLTIRKNTNGTASPLFWNDDIIGTTLDIMGPLGLNTADKMTRKKLYLISFGIGVSVIKSLLYGALSNDNVKEIHIITASRNENEVIYKDIFNTEKSSKISSVRTVLSQPIDSDYTYKGYIQDYINDYDFNHSDIYICGMELACESLKEKILEQGIEDFEFFIEGFH